MTNTNTEAVEALANIMANIRQGQSDTPLCEPPSQQSIDWCADRIREVRKAEAELAALSPTAKSEPSAAGLEADDLVKAVCDAVEFVDAAVGEGFEIEGKPHPLTTYEAITGAFEDCEYVDWGSPGILREYVLHALLSPAREAADHIAALEARNARLEEALKPFAFLEMGKDEDEGRQFTTQEVWETIYRDRVQDWVSFEDIERARTLTQPLVCSVRPLPTPRGEGE